MDQAQMAGTAAKIRWRIIVPTILFMLLSSVDRVNISFAALQMNADLGFTPAQYGFGAGILFAGFLAGQYPSIFLQQRIGFSKWLAVCAIVWGICAGSLGFVQTPMQFYVLRVALGFAEGGLAPGIVLYLSQFATERERATTFAMPMLAIPISIVLGAPLSGWLMSMSPFGLPGWRWMLIGEALPTILFGLWALYGFPDTPDQARWLTADEKGWLAANAANRRESRANNDWSILKRPIVWASALLWLCLLSGSYGIIFWLPQIMKQMTGFTPLEIGVISALPWVGNVFGVYFGATNSDRTGERFWHIAIPATIAALAVLSAAFAGANAIGLVALIVAGAALGAAQGAFWALPTRILTPATFAVAAVAINICGSSGGLMMPWAVGLVRQQTPSPLGPTALVAAILLIGVSIVLAIRASVPKAERN